MRLRTACLALLLGLPSSAASEMAASTIVKMNTEAFMACLLLRFVWPETVR